VYVDDIIFGSTKKELCIAFEKLMHEKFQMSSMGELTFFLGLQVKQKKDGIFISQDIYVAETLKKFGFIEVKTASTPMETQKPLLKDEDGEEVDVHMYRSMIGLLMYLTSSRLDIMFAVSTKIGPLVPKDSPFDLVAYTDSDYDGASLDRKSTTEVILNTARAKTINGKEQLHALVDGKKIIITESSVRRDLQLADEEGIDCLPNSTIFEQLTLMGPKTTAWNEFSSTMASVIEQVAVRSGMDSKVAELFPSFPESARTAALSLFHNVRAVAHEFKFEWPFEVLHALFDRERGGKLSSVLAPAAVPLEPPPILEPAGSE
ncbi:uncharacterized mitochondrial protein-like protein, partial [Tanacetum coccineum]